MASKKLILAGACGVTIAVLAALVFFARLHRATPAPSGPWNSDAITGSFAGIQVREIDPGSALVVFLYDLQNETDSDYRVESGPGVFILTRLKSDSSLSSDKPFRLNAPVFVPARNRIRVGLQSAQPFAWPADKPEAADDKFRELVARDTDNLAGFVLFDQATRYQIELRGAWPGSQSASIPSVNASTPN
jgi:hypothetical protein